MRPCCSYHSPSFSRSSLNQKIVKILDRCSCNANNFIIYLSLKTSHARVQAYTFYRSKRKHERHKEKERQSFGQLNSETELKLRQWVLPSVPASVGVWGKLLDTRWHGQKQRDWHRFSLVYFLPLLLHFQYSSHGEVLKMIFISSFTWHLIKRLLKQEPSLWRQWKHWHGILLSGTHHWARIHHSGVSGWTDRRVSLDKLWTRLCTDAHTWETTATYVHAHIPKTWLWISQCTQGCVWRSLRLGRLQEMTEVRVLTHMRNSVKKKRQNLLWDEDKARQNTLAKCSHWSHSWRHPQRSISNLDSSTTWKLISFVTSAKQSKQTKEKKCF